MASPAQRTILDRLAQGPATLAELRAALPAGDGAARALPSMGQEDPFGAELTALVAGGLVVDLGGRYALSGG